MQTLSNPTDLLKSTIFIINALHGQHWTANCLNLIFNRPLAKRIVQPDIVPAPEGRVGIVVIPFQAIFKVCFKIGCARPLNVQNADVLDQNMRSQHDHRAGLLWISRRVKQRDRRTIAMPEQPGWIMLCIDIEHLQQRR